MEPQLKGLSTSAVVLVLGLAVLIVGFVLGLVWLAGPDGDQEALNWVSSVASLIAGSFAASATVMGVRNARATKSITEGVEQVQQQTNGALDARLRAAILAALEQQQTTMDERNK